MTHISPQKSANLESYTENGEQLIELACRTCYSSFHRFNPPESTKELIQKVLSQGHFSVLEHAVATFKLIGVSRVLTHELVRHRLFSYSQESQRYVCYADKAETDQEGIKGKARKKTKDFTYTTPPDVEEGIDDLHLDGMRFGGGLIQAWNYHDVVNLCYRYYEFLLSKGIKPEDARYILPNATNSDIYVTGNVRSWRHFCQLRCHPRAQWDIREIANSIKDQLKEKFPNVFYDFPTGPLKEEDYESIIIT